MIRAIAATAAFAAAACADDGPDPSTLITTPRILAIAADPPVLGVDGVAAVRALIVDVDGTPVAGGALAMRACSPWRPVLDPEVDCAPGDAIELALDADGAGRLEVAAVLARFPPPTTPPDVPPSPCATDYAHVELPVVVTATVAGARLTAIKRARLASPSQTRRNPTIAEVLLDGAPAATYVPGAAHAITIRPDPASLDPTCTEDAPDALVPETVGSFLFVTAGALDAAVAEAIHDADGGEQLLPVTFTPPDDAEVVLWAVAVDPDGGIGWTHRVLTPLAP